VNAADELDAMLADLAQQAQHCRDFACIHGLEHSSTRKLARQAIRLVNHWRREAAATAATTSDSRCDAAAQRIGAADTSSPPSADRSNDVGGGAGDGQTTVCGRRSSAPSPTPTTPRL
jgi:hypothetical protein